jgi:SNF2 family DNA or RNA helicase
LLNKPLDEYCFDNDSDFDNGSANGAEQFDSKLDVDNNILCLIRNYDEVPCKFEAAYDLSQKIINDGGKLIIWCEFIGTCLELNEYLTEKSIRNAILYGGTPPEEREKIIIDFHEDVALSVIIANPHAVGESISLHKACHNALYLEQGYNAGVYMQSKDRIHRVGLKDTDVTNYYYYHAADSIDDVVYDRVMQKEQRMLELIESEEIPLLSDNDDFMEDMESDIKAIMRAYYERKK